MKPAIWALLVGASVSVAAAPAKQGSARPVASVLYDFKGVPLESTYEEFRTRPHPDGSDNATVTCTGDLVPSYGNKMREASGVAVYGIEKEAGVKECVWTRARDERATYVSAGETAPLKMADSGYVSFYYSFKFIPDPKDGVLRLYEVHAPSNTAAAGNVIDALSTKWGKPETVNDSVQNKLGASFPRTTATWSNPAATITVTDRWSKIDDMMLIMKSTRLHSVIDKLEEAEKAKQPNPI